MKFLRFLPALTWLIICTILLTLPGSSFPQENWFTRMQVDKWVHFGLFSMMVVLITWGLYKIIPAEKRSRYFIITMLLCLGYGIVMEFVQKYFIPNRSFDAWDIVADGVGSFGGWLFSRRVYIKK